MLTPNDAFYKFRTNLQTTDTDNSSASRRQTKIRDQIEAAGTLTVIDTFLTGAYRRETKTKPLRDVDIMIVIVDTSYLKLHPREILLALRAILAPLYGEGRVTCDRFAVRVDFGVKVVDEVSEDGEVISFDVVPAFEKGDHYLIPDDVTGAWIATNPKIHYDLAVAANKDFSEQWKPLVKMIKKWNAVAGQPVQPSFLIEVMALRLLTGPWTGSHPQELRRFFATAAEHIADVWPDPAHHGPDISGILDADPVMMSTAVQALKEAEAACTKAIRLEQTGRTSEALRAWRELFGPLFPLS
ncbi:nucleotidyltransferase [Actinomadura soli]|uniref:Nucleotidyltransferase n=1 Tax=Actinomadura soli TaxID=2508997 RepID=A0A5C4J107_9ACTN|nr:CBASS oligonucleotide cyclase [Actinomadura soli]TMQ90358.1 nucleotidyltransferase [Actinomadura soli]